MSEKPPGPDEQKEREPITEAQALEAMKASDFETVRAWYAEQEKNADQEPTGAGRTLLTFRLASMQLRAGFLEEGTDSIRAALMDAEGQGLSDVAETIFQTMQSMGIEP
jgi:hypothetical protein